MAVGTCEVGDSPRSTEGAAPDISLGERRGGFCVDSDAIARDHPAHHPHEGGDSAIARTDDAEGEAQDQILPRP